MKADPLIRLLFYLVESCLLTLPIAIGLLLIQRAASRRGWHAWQVTWRRMAVLAVIIGCFAVLTGELVGPQVIIQYYAAALVLAGGVCCWIVALLVSGRGRGPAPDPGDRESAPKS